MSTHEYKHNKKTTHIGIVCDIIPKTIQNQQLYLLYFHIYPPLNDKYIIPLKGGKVKRKNYVRLQF